LIQRIVKNNEKEIVSENLKDLFDELLLEIKHKYNDTKFT